MTITHGPFTIGDASAMAVILDLAQRSAPVARLVTVEDEPVYGTARSLGNDRGSFGGSGDDVRTMFLRVTTVRGWDVFWSVPDLIQSYHDGLLFPDAEER